MSFVVLPPEINSLRMFIGAGTAPMLAAAAAWDGLAEELGTAAQSFASVTAGLAGQAWQGPAALAMAAAAAPYAGWLTAAAAQSAGAAGQARAVASIFEAAQAATVLPAAVAANRDAFVQLVMTNLFGQNAPLIAAAEGVYEEMWAADVAAMSGYYSGASAIAAQVVPWASLLQRFPGLGAGATGATGGESVGTGGATASGGGVGYVGGGVASAGLAAGDPAHGSVGQGNFGGGDVGAGDVVASSATSAHAGVVSPGFIGAPLALAALGQMARGGTNSAPGTATESARAPEPAASAPPEAVVEVPELEVPAMGVLPTVDPKVAAKAAPLSTTRVGQSAGSGIPESTLRTAQGQQASETSAAEETAPSLRPEAAAGQLRPRVRKDPKIQMRGG
ncbi:PPE family protein [Mycobacterium tuberculosis]|uniref:PPE family protein n=1 Tax=Mycobacterium tuberculosis TaxID=1773 RepID=UPI0005E1CD9F|nr:PPE family protein [Mycobacterium tuberculosis]CMN93401.1 PPE-family protein [Mycobacterium tuberculosis]CNT98677.1 PPE-family protein [Mycobacterium tuberculosis]SGE01893.1 PPE-family protein [Mycobacterium tuberculosis]SGP56634.1 PPE-family protein [Mycobacterium tuberculosis]SGQ55772.1 PPE-family protein [Mycobacterium tuberculosis]